MNPLLKKHLFVLGLFLIITLVMTWPLAIGLTDNIAGRGGDPWQTMWRFEEKATMLQTALTDRNLTAFLQEEFFGGGEPRLINISVWPWMDMYYIFGGTVTYNIIYILSFVLSGYGMFLLVKYLLRKTKIEEQFKTYGAFIAGLFYMLAPYKVAHSDGHFGAMQMQWLPLSILWMLLWLKKPTLGNTVLLTLWLTLQAWTEHHYMLWLAVLGVILAIFQWKQTRLVFKPHRLPYFFLLASLLLFFVILPYWPTVRLSDQDPERLDLGTAQTIRYSANPFSYVTPSANHPIWGDYWEEKVAHKFTGNISEATQFLGWLPLLLIITGLYLVPKKQRYFWLVITFVFFVISLGPRLHLLGTVTDIRLPYAVLDNLPVFSAVRTVGRAASMVALGVAVLLGLVLARKIKSYSLAALIAGVIILEFLFFPIHLQSNHISKVYEELNSMPGSTVIDIPAAKDYVVSSKSLYGLHRHDKEILGLIALERGMDMAELDTLRSLPAVRQLLYLETGSIKERRQEFFQQDLKETFIDVSRYLNIGAVILHPNYMNSEDVSIYRDFLENEIGLTFQAIDGSLLYEIQGLPEGDGVFLARDKNWRNVTYDKEKDITLAMIKRSANIELFNITNEVKQVTLSWSVLEETPGRVNIEYEGEELNLTVANNRHELTINLPPGRHEYTFINQVLHDLVLKEFLMEVK